LAGGAAGCSSNGGAVASSVHWPTSGPGGCGTAAPSTIPVGNWYRIRAVAKAGVNAPQLLASVPRDTIRLWCVRVGAVYNHLHPPVLSLLFLPLASPADVEAARDYLESTRLFSTIAVDPSDDQ